MSPSRPPSSGVVYLTKVGPIEIRGRDAAAMYLAFAEDAEVLSTHVASPPDDAGALRKFVKRLSGRTVCCGLELARIGAAMGLEPRDLPPQVAAARAASAYLARASAPMPMRMGLGGPSELGSAAAAYLDAEPWTKLGTEVRFRMHASLIDHVTSKTHELDFLVHIQDGERTDGPSVELEDDGAFARILDYAPGERAPLRLRVTLAGEPEYLATAMEAAFGAYVHPRIAYTLGGRLMIPDEAHALLLAAAMRAAASHVGGEGAKTAEGRASSAGHEVRVRADFGDPRPAGPGLHMSDTPEGRRALARLVAHATAVRMPMPYYDGYVCVVAVPDPGDAIANRIWAKTEMMERHLDARRAGKGFEHVYRETVAVEGMRGRWMPALPMAEAAAEELGAEGAEWMVADVPPCAMRVLLAADGGCDVFWVDFDPGEIENLARQVAEIRRAKELVEEEERRAATRPASPPPAVEGTWRDGRNHLPDPLPEGWRVGERLDTGQISVTTGEVAFDVGAQRRGDRRWVNVLFRPHALGRAVSDEEAREVTRRLVACGRFQEMALEKDGEALPSLGMRIFSAPLRGARQRPVVAPERGEAELAALIERLTPVVAEATSMAWESKRPMSDFCVVIGAEPARDGTRDGVVMTRELVRKTFGAKGSDPFDVKGRFEEPRPEDECVVFVKHEGGIEEIHTAVEGVMGEWEVEGDA